MKLILRFVLPLMLVLGGLAYAMVPLAYHLTQRWFTRDLDIRSRLLQTTIQVSLAPLLEDGRKDSRRKALEVMKKATQDERLMAVGFCTPDEQLLLKTDVFPDSVSCSDIRNAEPYSGIIKTLASGDIHIAYGFIERSDDDSPQTETAPTDPTAQAPPETRDAGRDSVRPVLGKLLILHDMSFALRRSQSTRNYIFLVFLGIAIVTAGVTVMIARWSKTNWIRSMRSLVGGVRDRGLNYRTDEREFLPILKDLRALVRELEVSDQAKDDATVSWNAKTLKAILKTELSGEEIIVVANRQPYIHQRRDGKIDVQSPASGLVTAVEPILRACSGVWVAHGNGSADREVVDSRDRIQVPPGNPRYEIHRIWLSPEEEAGYYYGFANEGIWPLCHIAHIRPVFRLADWEHYVAVNQRFTDAIVSDSKTDDPVVLVQDYHFALVPRLLRERLPKATIITFWHIPWPNPESFGICPWRNEILHGLLGSSIIGFHTQFHCNNFIDCVDRVLESRIDRETNSISHQGVLTEVRAYPISVEWPPSRMADVPQVADCRREVSRINGLPANLKIGVGVDRLDYTKGIVERFRAVERLLEAHPEWNGRFSFIQIAAPSRSSIPAYQQLDVEVRAVAEQINARFGTDAYKPIILKIEHHEPVEVFKYFRAADVCVVTSLADGMNLVAKEFVAARDDERGALILSMFAGASREMMEALIVNPYDIEQSAAALYKAVTMPTSEQQERMHAMRAIVREFNVYRWAGRMLLDAARVRRRHQFVRRITPDDGVRDTDPSKQAHIIAALNATPGFNIGGYIKA